jgi:hypothetical protein
MSPPVTYQYSRSPHDPNGRCYGKSPLPQPMRRPNSLCRSRCLSPMGNIPANGVRRASKAPLTSEFPMREDDSVVVCKTRATAAAVRSPGRGSVRHLVSATWPACGPKCSPKYGNGTVSTQRCARHSSKPRPQYASQVRVRQRSLAGTSGRHRALRPALGDPAAVAEHRPRQVGQLPRQGGLAFIVGGHAASLRHNDFNSDQRDEEGDPEVVRCPSAAGARRSCTLNQATAEQSADHRSHDAVGTIRLLVEKGELTTQLVDFAIDSSQQGIE